MDKTYSSSMQKMWAHVALSRHDKQCERRNMLKTSNRPISDPVSPMVLITTPMLFPMTAHTDVWDEEECSALNPSCSDPARACAGALSCSTDAAAQPHVFKLKYESVLLKPLLTRSSAKTTMLRHRRRQVAELSSAANRR